MSPHKKFNRPRPPCLIKPTGMSEEAQRAHLLRLVTDTAYRQQYLAGLAGLAEKSALGPNKPFSNQ